MTAVVEPAVAGDAGDVGESRVDAAFVLDQT